MANGDIIRCSLQGQQNATVTVNTWHYVDRSGGSTLFDAPTGAQNFWTFMGGFLLACLTSDWVFTGARFAVVAGPSVGRVGYYYLAAQYGGITPTNPAPPEICISLKRQTGYAARSQRGRLFLGPVDSSLLSNMEQGVVDQTNASLIALANAMRATFTTDGVGLTPVLVGPKPTFTPTAAAVNYVFIAPGTVHRKTRRSAGLGV